MLPPILVIKCVERLKISSCLTDISENKFVICCGTGGYSISIVLQKLENAQFWAIKKVKITVPPKVQFSCVILRNQKELNSHVCWMGGHMELIYVSLLISLSGVSVALMLLASYPVKINNQAQVLCIKCVGISSFP